MLLSFILLSNKRPDLIAYEILGQEKEEDHVWLKVNMIFYLECVSFFILGMGALIRQYFMSVGHFFFEVGSSFYSGVVWPAS